MPPPRRMCTYLYSVTLTPAASGRAGVLAHRAQVEAAPGVVEVKAMATAQTTPMMTKMLLENSSGPT